MVERETPNSSANWCSPASLKPGSNSPRRIRSARVSTTFCRFDIPIGTCMYIQVHLAGWGMQISQVTRTWLRLAYVPSVRADQREYDHGFSRHPNRGGPGTADTLREDHQHRPHGALPGQGPGGNG